MYDPLIYGKNSIERIVSVEAEDGFLTLFIQNLDGTVSTQLIPNKYWILSNEKHATDWITLRGNLFYKYGKQYSTREEFITSKNSLRSKDIYSVYDPIESSLMNTGITYFKGMKHDEVSILSFDIETTSLEHTRDAKILLISNTFRKLGKVERKLFSYTDFEDEGKMLEAWCDWVKRIDPSLVCGHNIYGYDLPYMQFIADRYGVSLSLGRNGSDIEFNRYESKFRKDATQFYHYKRCRIFGREIVDTLFLSVKYDIGRKYDSYGLKAIIKHEGLEVKDRQFYDAGSIRLKYKDPVEWEKIKAYATFDADDSLALYDLMSPSIFYMTQSVPKSYQAMNYTATGSQINAMMVRAYLQEKHSIPKADMSAEYEGAISFGNPGIYNNVYKVDVQSLYPSVMIEYSVYEPKKDPDKKFLSLVKTFTERRIEYKKLAKTNKYYDDLQSAFKTLINSSYGFLGTPGLNFNAPDKAAFITQKGREILNKAIKRAKDLSYNIVNADTDSIAFSLSDNSVITKEQRVSLLSSLNSLFPDRIKWEDDGFYSKVIVLKAKNYILKDEFGKIKHKGSSVKATTKEPALREFIQSIITAVLTDQTNYIEIYNRYILEALDIKDIKRWASKKTLTDKVMNPKRTNEQKIFDAIQGKEYQEGDKLYVYFKSDNSLGVSDDYIGDYSKEKMLEKVFKTSKMFDNIIPKGTFINYKLKKNKKLLETLDIMV